MFRDSAVCRRSAETRLRFADPHSCRQGPGESCSVLLDGSGSWKLVALLLRQFAIPSATLCNKGTFLPQGTGGISGGVGWYSVCKRPSRSPPQIHMETIQIERDWTKVVGRVKRRWSALTPHDFKVIDGRRDRLVGRICCHYGLTRHEAENEVDSFIRSLGDCLTTSGKGGESLVSDLLPPFPTISSPRSASAKSGTGSRRGDRFSKSVA